MSSFILTAIIISMMKFLSLQNCLLTVILLKNCENLKGLALILNNRSLI